ncbi:MAG: thiamine phosphate synthase [Lachnospiraceae bacterium]|nr:thiamine phosphate synthase [Lachnospiraceae bacterium]
MTDYTLYGITDTVEPGESLKEQVEQAIQGGVTIIQLREKNLTGLEKKQEALEVLAVCRQYGIPFVVNDDVMLAKEIGADGVHLGQSDMEIGRARELLGEQAIIGITAKTIEQARVAEAAGATYLGSGAVFFTATKSDAKPMDFDTLDAICDSVSIPVVAIGGINRDNLLQLKGRHMQGFAVVGAIFHQQDIVSASRELKKLAEEALEISR